MHLRRNLFLIFSANTISNFASGITMLAIPWYLVNLPGEESGNLKVIAMTAGITFFSLFWGLYSGTLIDSFNRKRIFQVMQTVDAVVLAGIASVGWGTGKLPFVLIALGAATTIFSWTLFYPNLYAFCQELVDKKHYKKVNSGIEIQGQTTNFLGMLTGSVLLAGEISFDLGFWKVDFEFGAWELWEIFLMDGCTYFASMLIISLIKYEPGEYLMKAREKTSVWARLREGYVYLMERKPLLIFGIASFNIFFTLLVFIQAGLAIYVHAHLNLGYKEGASIMAGFEVWYSFGAIVAGLMGVFLARALEKTNLLIQIIAFLFLTFGIYLTLGLSNSIGLFFVSGFGIGITNAGTRILRITYIVRIVPNYMIGRVNTFFNAINVAMRLSLLSMLLLPFFSAPGNGGNMVVALWVMAGVCLMSGLVLIVFFKKFDQNAAYG